MPDFPGSAEAMVVGNVLTAVRPALRATAVGWMESDMVAGTGAVGSPETGVFIFAAPGELWRYVLEPYIQITPPGGTVNSSGNTGLPLSGTVGGDAYTTSGGGSVNVASFLATLTGRRCTWTGTAVRIWGTTENLTAGGLGWTINFDGDEGDVDTGSGPDVMPGEARLDLGCARHAVSWGILQDISEDEGADPDVFTNPAGETIRVILRNCRVDYVMSATLLNDVTTPRPGDKVIVEKDGAPLTCWVTRARKVWSNSAAATISVNATHWPGLS